MDVLLKSISLISLCVGFITIAHLNGMEDIMEAGGRYHSKAYRSGMQLDRAQTCEIDFSAIHMVLLYAIAGIDYWNDIGTDPYLLDDLSRVMRYAVY